MDIEVNTFTYVCLIEIKSKADFEIIDADLKTEFKSYDYMMGYCDGYLFDKYKLITLEEYSKNMNTHKPCGIENYYKNYYIKFLSIYNSVVIED